MTIVCNRQLRVIKEILSVIWVKMKLELMLTHSFLRNRAIKICQDMSIFKIEIMCLILKNSTSRICARLIFGIHAYEHHTQLDLCSRLATQCKAVDKLHDLCSITQLKVCNACICTFLHKLCVGVFHIPGKLTLFLWLQRGTRYSVGEFQKGSIHLN